MADFVFYPITSLMYTALAVYFWRTRWAVTAHSSAPRTGAKTLEHTVVLVPLILHATLLYESMFAGDGVRLGVGNAVSTIVWLTVAIYWLGLGVTGFFVGIACGFCAYAALTTVAMYRVKEPSAPPNK